MATVELGTEGVFDVLAGHHERHRHDSPVVRARAIAGARRRDIDRRLAVGARAIAARPPMGLDPVGRIQRAAERRLQNPDVRLPAFCSAPHAPPTARSVMRGGDHRVARQAVGKRFFPATCGIPPATRGPPRHGSRRRLRLPNSVELAALMIASAFAVVVMSPRTIAMCPWCAPLPGSSGNYLRVYVFHRSRVATPRIGRRGLQPGTGPEQGQS